MFILEDNRVTVTIEADNSISDVIDMRKYSRMLVHLPASGWTAADLGFLASTMPAGEFRPMFDENCSPVAFTNFFWGGAYCAPDCVGKTRFVRLWSCVASGSVDVAQMSDRCFEVDLKT